MNPSIPIRGCTDSDGVLRLEIPLNRPDEDLEVVIQIQPATRGDPKAFIGVITDPTFEAPSDSTGWPAGYFERVVGAIKDPAFDRPPQGEYPKPVDFD